MHIDKLRELTQFYKEHLQAMDIESLALNAEESRVPAKGYSLLKHCLWMLTVMELNLNPNNVTAYEMGRGRVWLGFIQGSLQSEGRFSFAEIQDHCKDD